MKKRIIAGMLGLLLGMCLIACGAKEKYAEEAGVESTESELNQEESPESEEAAAEVNPETEESEEAAAEVNPETEKAEETEEETEETAEVDDTEEEL